MEDLASMCERQCRKACNLRSAAEELEETGSNGRARRYRKRWSPKPATEARAMETDPSPVRLWSAADSEGHSEGYRTAYPSESEEMARPPTRAHTAPEPSLEHDAEALERPTRVRTEPVARHTERTPNGRRSGRPKWWSKPLRRSLNDSARYTWYSALRKPHSARCKCVARATLSVPVRTCTVAHFSDLSDSVFACVLGWMSNRESF